MTLKFITGIFLLLLGTETGAQKTDSLMFISLSASDFGLKYKDNDKALLIDVREFFEFRKSRLKNAINIPSTSNLEFASDTINRENSLFVYCTSGYRSKRVATFFGKQGFSKVYSLEGGIAGWKKAGNPIEKKRIRRGE